VANGLPGKFINDQVYNRTIRGHPCLNSGGIQIININRKAELFTTVSVLSEIVSKDDKNIPKFVFFLLKRRRHFFDFEFNTDTSDSCRQTENLFNGA